MADFKPLRRLHFSANTRSSFYASQRNPLDGQATDDEREAVASRDDDATALLALHQASLPAYVGSYRGAPRTPSTSDREPRDASGIMIKAYRFFPDDLRAAEDIVAGLDEPWHIGDIRTYTPMRIGSGDGEFITESGYHSSPTLWDALLQANGPIACLVEVSTPLSVSDSVAEPSAQISAVSKLVAAVDLRAELRRFACDCADRVRSLYEDRYPRDGRLRDAIAVARRFADAAASTEELQAALALVRDAADRAGGQARMAAFSAFGATLREAQDAALTAARSARWARDGRIAPGPERVWQRAHFDRLFAHLFAS